VKKRHRVGKGRRSFVVRGGGQGARSYTSGATALREFWTLCEQGLPAALAAPGGEYAATCGISSKEYPITYEAIQALDESVGDLPRDKIHGAAIARARKAMGR
jgi:hypothetical protein